MYCTGRAHCAARPALVVTRSRGHVSSRGEVSAGPGRAGHSVTGAGGRRVTAAEM